MTENDLYKIERTGAKKGLFEQINRNILAARILLESSTNERMKDFQCSIESAKELIADAEQMYERWNKP